MVICDRCHTFVGDPCRICRTVSRISFLVQTGRLRQADEEKILLSLRSTAGVISDLVEVGPTGISVGARNSGATGTGAAGETKDPEDLAAVKEEEEASGEVPQLEKKTKKDKKSKKEKKSKRAKENEVEDATVAEATGDGKEEEEIIVEELATEAVRKGELASLGGSKKGADKEKINKVVTDFAEENPETFGLESWPPKERSQPIIPEGGRSSGSRRPVEPEGPPPRRDGESARTRERPRLRSRSRRRGTKGAGHRERGRKWWAPAIPRRRY